MSLLNTELTFGVEFEPGHVLHYYYDEKESEEHYNREPLYKTDKFETTLEKYVNYYKDLDIESCPYNLELVFGVYKYPTIKDFLDDRIYHTNDIKKDIDSFNSDFVVEHKDRIRSLVTSDENIKTLYSDCALLIPRQDKSNLSYTSYFDNRDSIPLVGSPQITLGMSYAFFYPLMEYVKDVRKDVDLSLNILSELNMNMSCVVEGFLLSIIYYCLVHSIYVPKEDGSSYFKASFLFKPRTNFAISYQKLKENYPEIEDHLMQVYDMLISSYNDYSPSEIRSTTVLYAYKNYTIESILKDRGLSIRLPSNLSNQQKYMNTINILQRGDQDLYIGIIRDMTHINMIYLINNILNPLKVVEVKKFNFEKVDKMSPIFNGYLYRYKDDIKQMYDNGYILDYKVYEDGYAGLEPLPVLSIIEGKIRTPNRLEVLEWIPVNDNIIFEVRDIETVLHREKGGEITETELIDLIKDFFDTLKFIFTRFLKSKGILKPKPKSSVISSLLSEPPKAPVISSLLTEPPKAPVISSLLSEPPKAPVISSLLSEPPKTRKSVCNQYGCQLMFKPKKNITK